MTRAAALAVDGGNSKTDVLLVGHDGAVLGRVRGPTSTPHRLGAEGTFAVLDGLVREVVGRAGDGDPTAYVADVAGVYLAGADFPREVEELEALLRARGWAHQSYVDNDTLALLRAGTDNADAVAVVCGAGINCVGVRADGETVRYRALGQTSGDWGGGEDLGNEALWAAARDEDGRGPHTSLTQVVAEHFGLPTASAVAEAIHFGERDAEELVALAPEVLRVARDGDPVARALADRLVDEVAVLATTTLRRLDLLSAPAAVVLGGGVLANDAELVDAVTARVAAVAPSAQVCVVSAPPVLGAALAALDRAGVDATAGVRLRRDFAAS